MNFSFETIVGTIKDTLNTETVIGEPITFDSITLVPVMNVSFGFGGGGGPDPKGPNAGVGGGGGARLTVTGLVVIQDGNVRFLPTGRGGSIEKIMESIPLIIEQAKGAKKTESDTED